MFYTKRSFAQLLAVGCCISVFLLAGCDNSVDPQMQESAGLASEASPAGEASTVENHVAVGSFLTDGPASASKSSGPIVRVYQDAYGWGYPRHTESLKALGLVLGTSYFTHPISALLSPIPAGTDLVVVAYSGNSGIQRSVTAQQNLSNFLASGGTLSVDMVNQAFTAPGITGIPSYSFPTPCSGATLAAASRGADGQLGTADDHPLVKGPDGVAGTADDLTNVNIDMGASCAIVHNNLVNGVTLPGGATTLITSTFGGVEKPVLVEYPYLNGRVLVNTFTNTFYGHQPVGGGWEYKLRNIFSYALGLGATPTEDPVAVTGGPYSSLEGSAFTLDGSGSNDPDGGSIVGFEWDFDYDGSNFDVNGTGATPSHTYADNGTFTVALRVTDDEGATAISTTTAEIDNVEPNANAGSDAAIISGESFNFSGTFSDPGLNDDPWSFVVDWDNGAAAFAGSTGNQSDVIGASQQYCAVGQNTVSFSVTDKDNGIGTDALLLTVERKSIQIDIKPGSDENPISLQGNSRGNANGVIPVAVLTTPDFDAAQVDPATITLGDADGNDTTVQQRRNGTLMASLEDVDDDGDVDLILHFDQKALVNNGDLDSSTTSLTLYAGLSDGCVQVGGADTILIVR